MQLLSYNVNISKNSAISLYSIKSVDLNSNIAAHTLKECDTTKSYESYSYNEVNDLTSSIINYKISTYQYDDGVFVGDERYYYDNNGNLTAQQRVSYENGTLSSEAAISGRTSDSGMKLYRYDAFNRLVKYNSGSKESFYTYNADNLRTSKTVNRTRTEFVRNGQDLAAEMTGESINTYTYDVNGIHFADMNGTVQMYLKDTHNNVVGLMDANGNKTETEYDYDAFGNRQTVEAPNPFGYCGEYYDSESGLIYLRNRYYDSATGRFITEDPIKDGLNWYVYCGGNPIIFIDPTGYLRAAGYNKYGEWSENPDLDDFGAESVAYKALLTLSAMWENRQDDRFVIERLANLVRSTANKFGYEAKLGVVELIDPQSANEIDIILAVAYPANATKARGLQKDAVNKANELYGKDADGTIHNAFKHAYWNALMSYYISDDYAQLVGYAHEFGATENLRQENFENMNMDLYNNYVGRDIAWNYEKTNWYSSPKKEMADMVENAAKSGYLVILR